MRTLRTAACIPVAVAILAACATGESTQPADTFANGPLNPTVRTSVLPVETAPGGTTADTVPTGPVQIDVKVGTDDGAGRVEKVRVGTAVTLNILDPGAAQDYQIGVVGLEQKVAANVTATFNFTAGSAGRYEVRSKVTGAVLVVIEVV